MYTCILHNDAASFIRTYPNDDGKGEKQNGEETGEEGKKDHKKEITRKTMDACRLKAIKLSFPIITTKPVFVVLFLTVEYATFFYAGIEKMIYDTSC